MVSQGHAWCTEGVGTVETRVPRAGLPGPTTPFRRFRQGPGSPSLASIVRVFPSARDLSSRGHFGCLRRFCQGSSQKARRGLQPCGVPSPRSKLCLRDRAHMGYAPSAESRARLRAVMTAPQFSLLCIKQSTRLHQIGRASCRERVYVLV